MFLLTKYDFDGNFLIFLEGSEVFVGKIPRDCMEPELVPVFEKAGRIYMMRLMMDFSGSNRGYCFVQYFTPEEADRAVAEINKYEIRKGMTSMRSTRMIEYHMNIVVKKVREMD